MLKKVCSSLLIVVLVLSLVACGNSKESKEGSGDGPSLSKIKKEGEIVLGTSADYPPYEWLSKDKDGNTQVVGFDIALGQAVADKLGVKLKVQDMAFNGIIPSLKAGDVDIAISGLAANEERKEVIDFSEPYHGGSQGVLIRKEDAEKYKSKNDFKGAKVAAQLGSLQENLATELKGAEYEGMTNSNNIVLELKNKAIDAMIVAGSTGTQFAQLNDDLLYQDVGFEEEDSMAVGVAKGNEDLIKIINEVIKDWADSGKMKEELDHYTQLSNEEAQELK